MLIWVRICALDLCILDDAHALTTEHSSSRTIQLGGKIKNQIICIAKNWMAKKKLHKKTKEETKQKQIEFRRPAQKRRKKKGKKRGRKSM